MQSTDPIRNKIEWQHQEKPQINKQQEQSQHIHLDICFVL